MRMPWHWNVGPGLVVEQQRAIDVRYRDTVVRRHVAELFVEDAVLIELKAVRSIGPTHFGPHSAHCAPRFERHWPTSARADQFRRTAGRGQTDHS